MNRIHFFIWLIVLTGVMVGCATTSPVVQEDALPPMPFSDLIAQAGQYKGQMVVLSGYVLEVENLKDHTRIVALQAPIGSGQQPKSKDFSEGRLVLIYNGFIDPEVYTKDRRITVGGVILASSADDPEAPYPYLKIEVRDIHLWPEESSEKSDPCWERDRFYDHYPWYWRYPYWRSPYYWNPYWSFRYWRPC